MLNAPQWIHRRVETIEFVGENRVRRKVSFDFTLPNLPTLFVPSGRANAVAYVPLTFLHKAVLERFDLRDENGRALSLLGQSQHNLISGRMLVGSARTAVSERLQERLNPELAHDLRAIVSADEARALALLDSWRRTAASTPTSQRDVISSTPEAEALMQDLSTGFVLFVPLEARPGDRRVIKYSHEQEFRRPQSVTVTRRARVKRELLLEPWQFAFGLTFGGAASTHIEVPAPEDMLVAHAEILSSGRAGTRLAQTETVTELAHLRVPRQARGIAAVLIVNFVLRASGILSAATLIATFTTLMLFGGVSLHFFLGVPVRTDAAGAVVVVAPAIFAPFLAISASHRLVRRVVRMLRTLLLAAAVISFAAAASLVASFPRNVRPWLWVGLLVLSLGPTVVLVTAWINAYRIERAGGL